MDGFAIRDKFAENEVGALINLARSRRIEGRKKHFGSPSLKGCKDSKFTTVVYDDVSKYQAESFQCTSAGVLPLIV